MAALVAVAVVVLVLVWVAITFNRLVRSRNQVADGWAGIDVQLTRRADLVPVLVETVKGYRDFERGTLVEVVDARSRAVNAQGPAQSGSAEQQLTGSLKTIFATAEAYPDLKADAGFRTLQQQLSTLEEDISFARRYYNAQVRVYNTRQQTFPTLLVARPLGFRTAEYFQADADDREVPDADL
ncbi:MAG: LemA family protein [Acidimicrobiia bacterium]|nr:LemA family protein [Acidimicrobiia bacterium]